MYATAARGFTAGPPVGRPVVRDITLASGRHRCGTLPATLLPLDVGPASGHWLRLVGRGTVPPPVRLLIRRLLVVRGGRRRVRGNPIPATRLTAAPADLRVQDLRESVGKNQAQAHDQHDSSCLLADLELRGGVKGDRSEERRVGKEGRSRWS